MARTRIGKSARRPQQLYSVVMWVLSVIFAGFLIGLGSLVIRDLPKVDRDVVLEEYVLGDLDAYDTQLDALNSRAQTLDQLLEDRQADLATARADYESERLSFENWIATRAATEAADTNPEVIARTRQLEALQRAERGVLSDVEQIAREQVELRRDISRVAGLKADAFNSAQPGYQSARSWQELRVFLYRLAITLPLILVSAWMLLRKRGSAYWPLYRGFILFSAFAFFVELVPYLPSYGGYVRYAVGIAVVMVAGHFLIRAMRDYLERKQAEEERSEAERRRSIGYETALKKIGANTCPGCDRAIVSRDGVQTDFCVHCGIRLADDCSNCGARNVSFYRFCLSCGVEKPVENGLADAATPDGMTA